MSLFGADFGWRIAAIFAGAFAVVVGIGAAAFVGLALRGPTRDGGLRAVAAWTFGAIAMNVVSLLVASPGGMASRVNENALLYALLTYGIALAPAIGAALTAPRPPQP